MNRPLLIGEAPSRGGDRFWEFPLSGPPARVLCQAAGIPPDGDGPGYGRWTWALYDLFECRNLFDRFAEAEPWSATAARARGAALIDELGGRVVVALGRRVTLALGLGAGCYEWVNDRGLWVASVPHPSGLNRVLNDPEERAGMGATLREALRLGASLAGVGSA